MNALQVNRSVTPATSTDLNQMNSASWGNLAKPSSKAYAKEIVPPLVADLTKPAAPVAPTAPAAVPPSASAVYVLPKAPNTSVVPAAPTAPTTPKAPTAPEAPAGGLSQAYQAQITDALKAESNRGLRGGNKDMISAIVNTAGFKMLTEQIVESKTLGPEQAINNYKLKTQQLTDIINAVVPGFNGKRPELIENFSMNR
jgi:hypothetical protein